MSRRAAAPRDATCAACGKALRRGKGLRVAVWADEGIDTWVCSAACREAYSERAGGADASHAPSAVPTTAHRRAPVAVLGAVAAAELARAAAQVWLVDPLAMPSPWLVHAATASVLLFLAAGLWRGRRGADRAALAVATIVAAAHLFAAFRSSDLRPLLLPASLTVPMFLLLIGRPGTARASTALAAALLFPFYVAWHGGRHLLEREASLERIAEVTVDGSTVGGSPGSVRGELAPGWRRLVPRNGIVDWPHSELEMIEPSTGAAGFVVLNPDCSLEGLPDFQGRSMDALAEAGGDPIVTGLRRVEGGATELRVDLVRSGRRLRSFELFRALPGEADPPGCIWLHCHAPPRHVEETRAACRAMAASIERVPEA